MRRLSVLLVLLCGVFALYAETLNVGLYATAGLEDFSSEIVSTLFTLLPDNSRLERINYERHMRQREDSRDSQVHAALASEAEVPDAAADEYIPYSQCDPVWNLVVEEVDDDFITSRSLSMLDYTSLCDSLDLGIGFSSSPQDRLTLVEVFIYIEGRVEEVYSALCIPSRVEELAPEILSQLIAFFTRNHVLLQCASFARADLYDESGSPVPQYGGYAVIPRTTSDLTARRSGYEDLSIQVSVPDDALMVTLEGEMVMLPVGQVTVTAHPQGASARLFGLDVDLPLTADFDSSAVVLSISLEGFRDENLQLTPGAGFHSVILRPQWMAGDDLVRQAKDEMYRALRNTLLSFGAYVIMSSVSNIYPQAAVWSGIASSLAAGVSVVNLMDFLHDCMVYYDSARAVYL